MDKKYQKVFWMHAHFYRLLGNFRRLEIIQLLTNGELTVSEMVRMLGVPQPNLSQHLAILRISGVVITRRVGVKIYYHLSSPKIKAAFELVREVLSDQAAGSKDRFQKRFSLTDTNKAFNIVTDPVCGMKINKNTAESLTVKDKTFYFCASGCRRKFERSLHRLQ
jgi:ArsR family transcriptional regulator